MLAFGLFFVLTAVVSLLGPRYERWTRGALLVSTILLAPLIVILSLALSDATDTNVIQLIVESLRLGTPIALGAMAGSVVPNGPGVVNIAIEGMMLAAAGVGFTLYAVARQRRQHRRGCGSRSAPRCSPAASSPRCTRWCR